MEGGKGGLQRDNRKDQSQEDGGVVSGQGLQVQRTEAQGRDPHSPEGSWRKRNGGVLCGILDAMGVVKRERGGLEKEE